MAQPADPRQGRHVPIHPTVDPLAVQAVAKAFHDAGLLDESTLLHEAGRWHVYVSAKDWNPGAEAAWTDIRVAARGLPIG